MVIALAQTAKKYSKHEYDTIKDTIELRNKWTKNTPINEKVKTVSKIEDSLINLQAVFEKYPELKADKLYEQMMGPGSITSIEKEIQDFRLEFNEMVKKYNESTQRFPTNIVAAIHRFKMIDYLFLGEKISNTEKYKPKELFVD